MTRNSAWPLPPPPAREPGALVFVGRHCYRVNRAGILDPVPDPRPANPYAHVFPPPPRGTAWHRVALGVAIAFAVIAWMLRYGR
jgi:hypothetical protein